jgi:dTDP-4-dehydrorhamnose reductase
MNIFIIGASGLVGSHCLNILKDSGYNVIGSHLNYSTPDTLYFDPLSVDIDDYFNQINFSPSIILHCAALTNVDYCEQHIDESYNNTVEPTRKIAEYCLERKIKLIYISTDYVFDGTSGPYTEEAETNPINIYGRHKLESEQLVQKLQEYLILRVTNVYGEESRSKNFISRLLLNLSNNDLKELNLPTDQYATPIYARDIARMILLLIQDNKCGLYHLSSTDYYNRYQLAMKVKTYFNSNSSITLTASSTASIQQAALRPLYGGLLNIKFISEYPTFLFTNVDTFILKSLKNEL